MSKGNEKPKKPPNLIAMNLTEDTLTRVCAVLTVLQNQRDAGEVMMEEERLGIHLILESAIEALKYEGDKIGRAGRAS